MMLRRVLPFALMLAALPLGAVEAQFGGMPGLPGGPGMPGMPGMPGGMPESPGMPGFGAPQQGPPPACQKLLSARDEAAKHGQALQAVSQKKEKPPAEEVCKLFKAFVAAESKFLKSLEENSSTCGVPPDIIKQVKLSHNRSTQTTKNICDAAAQGPRPAGPTLSDALGTTPTVPDASSARGQGTFDTLVGSPLAR